MNDTMAVAGVESLDVLLIFMPLNKPLHRQHDELFYSCGIFWQLSKSFQQCSLTLMIHILNHLSASSATTAVIACLMQRMRLN